MPTVTTESVLSAFGEQLVSDLRQAQRQKNLVDQGISAKSTRAVITANREIKILKIIGAKHWRYQQNGRGPNRSGKPSRQMVEDLKGWAKRHGMDESAGWPIAIKIARKGIDVPNPHNPGGVLSEPLDPSRVIRLLKVNIRPVLIESARSLLFG